MLRRLLIVFALIVSAETVTSSSASNPILLAPIKSCPGQTSIDAPAKVQIAAMRCLVNYARVHAGLKPVHANAALDKAAMLKRNDVVRCKQFSHTACGKAFLSDYAASGYGASKISYRIGENIAWGVGNLASPRAIFNSWLLAPKHRANLLDPTWTDGGLSVARALRIFGSYDVAVWVSSFGHRS